MELQKLHLKGFFLLHERFQYEFSFYFSMNNCNINRAVVSVGAVGAFAPTVLRDLIIMHTGVALAWVQWVQLHPRFLKKVLL